MEAKSDEFLENGDSFLFSPLPLERTLLLSFERYERGLTARLV